MYKLCKTERSAARQRELELGLQFLMQSRRYEDISVSDLCDHLQIPRKAFYRYFSSKDGAFHALLDHTLLEYESFPGSYQSGESRTIEKDLERFFLFWQLHRPLLDAVRRNRLTAVLIQRCIESSMSGTTIPLRFTPNETPEGRRQLLMFSICGLMSMVMDWHYNGYSTSAAQMGRVAARLLNSPLFTRTSDPIAR